MSEFSERHDPPVAHARPVVLLHGGNVANWMWAPQVQRLADRVVLTPHLPGFGDRVGERWPGLPAVADDLVERIRQLGVSGPFDLVGLSLGANAALSVAAQHPASVNSLFVSGAMALRAPWPTRLASRVQLGLWNAPWFWRAQAVSQQIPFDSRDMFVAHGLSIVKENMRRVVQEFCAANLPRRIREYGRPLLAVVGQRESSAFTRSLTAIRRAAPHATLRRAPGVRHMWSMEDADLFTDVLRGWSEHVVDPRLLDVH